MHVTRALKTVEELQRDEGVMSLDDIQHGWEQGLQPFCLALNRSE
jgi:hypothetical protein